MARPLPTRLMGTTARMAQLDRIEAIEARLWRAADLLRSNSELASNEYFMPVMGLIFLRHAYSRFLAVKPGIEASLPSRHGVTRGSTPSFPPCAYSAKSSRTRTGDDHPSVRM